MADVFISYKREDRPLVEEIAARLRRLKLTVWFDAGLAGGGRRIVPAISLHDEKFSGKN